MWQLLFITLVSVQVLPVSTSENDRKTNCEIHAEEKESEKSAILMCNFSQNVAKTRRQFQVKQLSSSSSKEQIILLACLWIESELDCYTNPKCSFDGNVTSQLKVKIHNITEEDSCRYECNIVPSRGGIFESCTLTRLSELTEASAVVYDLESRSLTFQKSTSVFPTGFQGNSDENWNTTRPMGLGDLQDNQEDFSAWLYLTIPLVVAIILVTVVVGVFWRWKRHLILKAEIHHTEDNLLQTTNNLL